jgi:hypothetical protein
VAHDLFHGRTLTFSAGQGLKNYSFRIAKGPLLKLLAWFPHKGPAERLKEVRLASVAVCLFGVMHLVMQPFLAWQWGALLLLAGGLGLVFAARECYWSNGAALIAAGLWSLFPWSIPGIDPRDVPWEEQLVPLVAGSILIIWGIQQFAMLSPNQALRAARAIRDRQVDFTPQGSRIVRRTGIVSLSVAAALGCYATVALILWLLRPTSVPPDSLDPLMTDVVAVGGMALTGACVGGALLYRRSALYREARVAGQLIVVTCVLGLWAAGFAISQLTASSPAGFDGLIGSHLDLLAQPYVWVSFIPFVLIYNRWFVRAVDREMEELRD